MNFDKQPDTWGWRRYFFKQMFVSSSICFQEWFQREAEAGLPLRPGSDGRIGKSVCFHFVQQFFFSGIRSRIIEPKKDISSLPQTRARFPSVFPFLSFLWFFAVISSVSTFQSSLEAAALALCRKQEEAGECDVMLEVFFVVARRHHASSWLNSALKGSVSDVSSVSV